MRVGGAAMAVTALSWLLLSLLACTVARGNGGAFRRRFQQGRRGSRSCNCRRWIQECQQTCRNTQGQNEALQNLRAIRPLLANSSFSPNLDPSAFMPTLPAPADVECWVEVQQTRLVGGRCKQFGRLEQRVCQAGVHMELYSPECRDDHRQGRPRPAWRGRAGQRGGGQAGAGSGTASPRGRRNSARAPQGGRPRARSPQTPQASTQRQANRHPSRSQPQQSRPSRQAARAQRRGAQGSRLQRP